MPKMNVKKWLETKSGQADDLEQKSITLEVKASDEETNVIEGYASTFGGVPDHVGDIVAQGAFAKTIIEDGNQVKMLVSHSWRDIIGKVVELKEDAYGLWFKAKISDTPRGNEIMTLIKDGVLDKISMGYRTIKSKWDHENHTRTLEEVKLYELSVVPIPANDRAIITGAKNDDLDDLESKAGRVLSKKTEKALREAVDALETASQAMAAAQKEVADVLALVDNPEPEQTDEEKQAALEAEQKRLADEQAETEKKARILELMKEFKEEAQA